MSEAKCTNGSNVINISSSVISVFDGGQSISRMILLSSLLLLVSASLAMLDVDRVFSEVTDESNILN